MADERNEKKVTHANSPVCLISYRFYIRSASLMILAIYDIHACS